MPRGGKNKNEMGSDFFPRRHTLSGRIDAKRGYGLKQEFITPHRPQRNGMVERLIRTLKEQCVHRHRFENQPLAIVHPR